MSLNLKHVLFWLTIYILWSFMKSSGGGDTLPMFLKINLVNIPIFMAAFYFLKHVQIPYLYNQNKKVLFVLSLILSSFFLYFIWRVAGLLWFDDMRRINASFMRFDRYLMYAVQFYSPGVLLLAWEMNEEKAAEASRIKELEKQKIETELKFLKAQLNPHFLFNTFNNLYSLVITGDPNAPNMILQLSSILEFVLYKSQEPKIPLREEIEVVEKYIALEQIRYGDKLEVELETKGDLAIPVSPLLILSLVENAFKHGASGDIYNPKIKITIEAKEKQLYCNIWNTKSIHKGELKDIHKKGIGLSNIKRQLHLQYPDQHDLKIDELENSYEVSLKLTP